MEKNIECKRGTVGQIWPFLVKRNGDQVSLVVHETGKYHSPRLTQLNTAHSFLDSTAQVHVEVLNVKRHVCLCFAKEHLNPDAVFGEALYQAEIMPKQLVDKANCRQCSQA